MKKIIIAFVFLLVCGISINIQAQGYENRQEKKAPKKGYKVGDTATDFKLKNVDGQFYSLSDLDQAKGYIIVFTSNECPFAIMYEDRLIELHNKMVLRGYPVVAINPNDESLEEGDSFENMQIRSQEKGFPYLYLDDAELSIYPQYGATKTPHVFLLDKDLTVQYIGAIDDNAKSPEDVEIRYVENAITALENGSKPDPNFTKAIGCGIKSKSGKGKGGGKPERGGRRGPPSPDKIIEMMDQDSDGKVSKSEVHGPLKNDFDKLDKDGDGFLTLKELAGIKRRK